MKRIVYIRPEGDFVHPAPMGQVTLVNEVGDWMSEPIPVPVYPGRMTPESEDEFIARIMAKDVPPDATDVRVVDPSELEEITGAPEP